MTPLVFADFNNWMIFPGAKAANLQVVNGDNDVSFFWVVVMFLRVCLAYFSAVQSMILYSVPLAGLIFRISM